MKMKRLGALLAVGICSAAMLTGCSFQEIKTTVVETTHSLFGKTEEVTSEKKEDKIEKSGKAVDESVEKPEFTGILDGTVQLTMGSNFGILSPAEVSEGTVTYQWYSNNVDSNGGGTPVENATEDHLYVDTSAPSHKFFYVVATNEVDGKINKNTSGTIEVVVWDIGSWLEGEDGKVRYMMIDGTYPKNTWFQIDGNFCYVKEDGARSTGLVEIEGKTYYFSDEGYLQKNTTGPNGELVDENGVVHPVEQPAEQPTEQPAEQ
ncbi:MAG: hypothetical protein Q4B85_00930 [Lachnospiraceae bacterium]|nr:hypothetical protein [Lachnospiraceae bacterium]